MEALEDVQESLGSQESLVVLVKSLEPLVATVEPQELELAELSVIDDLPQNLAIPQTVASQGWDLGWEQC